jgi:hypothetical protein
MIAGTTFSNYFISKQFWNYVETDRQKSIVINSTTLLFGRLTGIGGAVTIISGFAMVTVLHGVIASQLWFKIKMILVLLIILNASFVARKQNKKLLQLLSANNTTTNVFDAVKLKMNIYYAVQFLLLIIIFALSVFKFN